MNIVCLPPPEKVYIDDLKQGYVHVVAFAEEGFSVFKAYLEFAFGIGVEEGVELCNRINRADETGTIWPKGNLTALPKRFFREPLRDTKALRRNLRDSFVANRDFCKCHVLIFEFTCAVMNSHEIYKQIEDIYRSEFDTAPLEKVVVHFDTPVHG